MSIDSSSLGHLFPAPRRHRPRVRVRPHRLHPHLRRMGAGRHRRAGHPQQERVTVSGGFFCIFADCEVLTPLHTATQKQVIRTETKIDKILPVWKKSISLLDKDYSRWISELSSRYRIIQIKAALKVN